MFENLNTFDCQTFGDILWWLCTVDVTLNQELLVKSIFVLIAQGFPLPHGWGLGVKLDGAPQRRLVDLLLGWTAQGKHKRVSVTTCTCS